MTTFTISRPHGFRLDAAADFYAGFIPGSGMSAAGGEHLTLAFRLDRTFEAVAVSLREEGDAIVAEYSGTRDAGVLQRQLERMLGLGGDGHAWLELGEREPLVGRLQAEFPGFFTAAKASPYDAATWAVIAPRMNMKQAASVKRALAHELGESIELAGREHTVFPSPAALFTGLGKRGGFPGLSEEKVARLKGIASAARGGKLDAERLRSMPEDDALAELQTLRGVGPWAASHIYFRGAAPEDALPTAEPRVLHGLAHAAGIDAPSPEAFQRMAASFRPFRMWVCVLLSRHLAGTGEWRAPGLARERADAGRALARRTRSGRQRVLPLLRA